jgi:hypothetical protein
VQKVRSKLTYANVMATIALFVALGGASYAATQLPENSVGSKQLKKNAVTTAKIKKGAVTGAKIKASTLGAVPRAANAAHADSATVAASITPPEASHLVGASGEPPFAPKWQNNGNGFAPVSFYKDREGVVHLEGLAEGSSAPALVFTLPPGYRPTEYLLFVTFGYSGAATDVRVAANGEVTVTNEFEVSLNGVSFRAG